MADISGLSKDGYARNSPDGKSLSNSPACCATCGGCECSCPQPCYRDGGIYDLSCSAGTFKRAPFSQPVVTVQKSNRYTRICCGAPLTLAYKTYWSQAWSVDNPCRNGFVTESDEIWVNAVNENTPQGGTITTRRKIVSGNPYLCTSDVYDNTDVGHGQSNGCLAAITNMFDGLLRTPEVPYEVSFLVNQAPNSPSSVDGWWSQSNYAFSMVYIETYPPGTSGYPWTTYNTRYLYQWAEPGILPSCGNTCRTSCCLPDGKCREDLTDSECRALGGHLNAPGISCYVANCGGGASRDKGACCDPLTGLCSITSPEGCVFPKVFKGVGTRCLANTCPQPTGACCINGGAQCQVTTQAACGQQNGTWHGAGTNCSGNICNRPGACCLPDGTCIQTQSAEACLSLGGAFQGPDSSCDFAQCTGACCQQTSHGWDCFQSSPQGCNGTFYGLGTTCGGITCGSSQRPPRGFSYGSNGLLVPDSKVVVYGAKGLARPAGCSACQSGGGLF